MGIGDKDGAVAARNAQTEKNTSHSRRNKNFHAERYLSLFPTLLLVLASLAVATPFLQDFTGLFAGWLSLLRGTQRGDSSVSLLSVTPSPVSSLSRPQTR